MKKIISFKQVAEILGVHPTTIYRWCNNGIFVPKVHIGPARVGFFETDVADWAEQRCNRSM